LEEFGASLSGTEAADGVQTQEQDDVIQQALMRALAKNRKEAYEAGCAALRRQLQELLEEENAKQKAAARA
jgi:hypothetical protein